MGKTLLGIVAVSATVLLNSLGARAIAQAPPGWQAATRITVKRSLLTHALSTGAPGVTIACPAGGAAPTTVTPGGNETFTASVQATQAMPALVSFEVYDAANIKLAQTGVGPLTLTANTPQSVTGHMTIPAGAASGRYTVRAQVYGPNWTPFYVAHWACSSFTIASAASPTGTAPAVPSATATDGAPPATAPALPPTATAPARELTGNGAQASKGVVWNQVYDMWCGGILANCNWAGIQGDLADMSAAGIVWARTDFHQDVPFSFYDQLLQSARAHNVTLLFIVEKSDPAGDLGTSAQQATYQSWLAQAVNRYKQDVSYWEIQNEENLSNFWNIDSNGAATAYAASVQNYVTDLRESYQTIKANDPTAQVLLGGMSEWTMEQYVDQLIADNAYLYFDIVAFHPYGSDPNGVISRLNSLKAKMAAQSGWAAKPIWITEVGFNCYSSATTLPGTSCPESFKAQNLTATMQQLRSDGITTPIFWYNMHDGGSANYSGYGLVYKDMSTLQTTYEPSFYAYQSIAGAPASSGSPTAAPVPGGPTATPTTPPTTTVPPVMSIACPVNGAAPATIAPGGNEVFTANVQSNQALNGALVSFEVYDAANIKLAQTGAGPLTLTANTSQSVTGHMTIPAGAASGRYTVRAQVYGPNWTPFYVAHWACSSFTIASAASPTSTAPAIPSATVTDGAPPATAPAPTTTGTANPGHTIKNVFLIVLENHNWSAIKGNPSAPYINDTLLPLAAHAENYMNPPGNHPSLPNYLWLEAGTNFGITDDNDPYSNHQSASAHLTTLLTHAGISWKTYQENIAGTQCPLTASYPYAPKHNPFVYFDDVTGGNNTNSATCIAHVRPYTELTTDLQRGTVARYNFITPNLCDDGHDWCAPYNDPVKQTDTWLSQAVPAILRSQAYQDGGALFITWDEGEGGSDGPIGMIALSPYAKHGYANAILYTHSSTLRTIEEIFGVGPMLGDAANATDLRDLFTSFP